MDLQLFIKEGNNFKVLKVPVYVVKNLLRDKLSQSELDRINRLAEPTEIPEIFKSGSVVVNFNSKSAECYDAKIDLTSFEATWKINQEKITLHNY